jgi:hypothetical protein
MQSFIVTLGLSIWVLFLLELTILNQCAWLFQSYARVICLVGFHHLVVCAYILARVFKAFLIGSNDDLKFCAKSSTNHWGNMHSFDVGPHFIANLSKQYIITSWPNSKSSRLVVICMASFECLFTNVGWF